MATVPEQIPVTGRDAGARGDSAGALKTPRTKLRRLPKRGAHDRPTIDAILDEALISPVASGPDGNPAVIPTLPARVGDDVLIHGSAASRMLRALSTGVDLCLTA